jgi:hypothetical protein
MLIWSIPAMFLSVALEFMVNNLSTENISAKVCNLICLGQAQKFFFLGAAKPRIWLVFIRPPSETFNS